MVTIEQALGIPELGYCDDAALTRTDRLVGDLRRHVERLQQALIGVVQDRQQQPQAAPADPDEVAELKRDLLKKSELEIRLKNELEMAHKELTTLRAREEDRKTAEEAGRILTSKRMPTGKA